MFWGHNQRAVHLRIDDRTLPVIIPSIFYQSLNELDLCRACVHGRVVQNSSSCDCYYSVEWNSAKSVHYESWGFGCKAQLSYSWDAAKHHCRCTSDNRINILLGRKFCLHCGTKILRRMNIMYPAYIRGYSIFRIWKNAFTNLVDSRK